MAVLATACGKEEVNTAESQTQITEEASTEALQTQTSERMAKMMQFLFQHMYIWRMKMV